MENVNFIDCVDTAKNMLNELNISYNRNIQVYIKDTSNNSWGVCHRNKDNTFTITINSKVLHSSNAEEVVIRVVLHEFLHTVRGCFNHGKAWKHYAQLIKERFGFDITRTASYDMYDVAEEYIDYKYKVVCNTCGATSYYKRACTIVNEQQCICRKCHGESFTVYNANGTIHPKTEVATNYKYTITCDSCGKKFNYSRAGKIVQNYERYQCGCGGHLTLTVNV